MSAPPSPAPAGFRLAPFRFDVTPPLGHSCCAGWIKPVIGYDDPLEAIGAVLWGAGEPVVVCAVDWLGLSNAANLAWRSALAEAAGATPDRVSVHCVHQHNTPFVCLEAARMVAAHPELPPVYDPAFFRSCLERAGAAVRGALGRSRPVTHVAAGQARVERVASNRRVARDAAGRVTAMRRTRCTDPELVALPEGLIDPWLKTVAFYDGAEKIAAFHYYATHPMSYYEDGRVSSDFCGLARRRRQEEEPGCAHLYFNGCGANLGAGKYNDGSPAARRELTDRMHRAIAASERTLEPRPLRAMAWRTRELRPDPNPAFDADALRRTLDRTGAPDGAYAFGEGHQRALAAFKLAWLERCRRGEPVLLSELRLDDISLLHLPAEVFVEYQLRAQAMRPDRFVAVAAYGDFGPFYVPTREEFPCGGYEVSMAFCADTIDGQLTEGMRELLGSATPPESKKP
jgi:hypothetical protein